MTLRPTAGCAIHSPLPHPSCGRAVEARRRLRGPHSWLGPAHRSWPRYAFALCTAGATMACSSRDGAPVSDRGAKAQPTAGVSPTPAGATVAPNVPPDAASLVGRLLDDVVPDSSLFGSWTVYPVERRVGIRHVVHDGQHLLLADTLEGHDGDRARWRIRQVQPVESPGPGEGFVASCALRGADATDGTVVARVTLSPDESLTPIHAAWRLDPSTWRFASFPTDSLDCYNEGGGP